MATYHIDPSNGSDSYSAAQAQSTATPWRTWAKATASGNWSAGNSFLQKRGTECNETPTFQGGGSAESARVTIGAYGDETYPKPTIIGAALQFGIRWFSGASYLTVQDFAVRDMTGTATNHIGIGGGGGADNDYVIIERCDIDSVGTNGSSDCDGIQLFGQGAIIRDCVITNIADDGIWLRSNAVGPKIYNNRIVGVAQSGRTAGDCIQLDGSSIGFLVENNFLDYVSSPKKQIFIVSSATSGYGGRVLNNFMRAPYDASAGTSGVYSDQPNTIVAGNWIEGCQYGINVQAAGMRACGNIMLGSYIGASVNGLGVLIDNNTVLDHEHTGIYAPLDDVTAYIRNNIAKGNAVRGIHSHGSVNKATNCYHSNGTDWVTAGGGGAIEGGAVLADPILDADYRLGAASPCRGAGTYIAGARHFGGRSLRGNPDIGAHRYFDARQLAAARLARASATTTTDRSSRILVAW